MIWHSCALLLFMQRMELTLGTLMLRSVTPSVREDAHQVRELLMFIVLLCAPTNSSLSSIVGMPGMFRELAQKGRDILSKCNDQLEDAEEPEHGRAVWIQMRELLDRREQEGGRQLGSAEDKGVYNILHMHFMEDRGHTAV